MKNNFTGKPNALKQVNLSMVRRAILDKGTATRAEIVRDTNISTTTVRTLLTELQNTGELLSVGFDDSSGGRNATRYVLNKELFFGVSLFLDGKSVRYLTVNICGEICKTGVFDSENDTCTAICSFLDELCKKIKIRAIGIGVPGIVKGLDYARKNEQGVFEHFNLGEVISSRYNLPVLLENDLNAIALGFGRCYLKSFPDEKCENVNMAYIYFDADCISAGFLSSGKIVRGYSSFVGELGQFPLSNGQTLEDVLCLIEEDSVYVDMVVKMIAGVCCIINPQYIALGGPAFKTSTLPFITERLAFALPTEMSAEILYASDKWHDYFEGMAYLTADQIFADVRLVKE